jgi:hypothetical protein
MKEQTVLFEQQSLSAESQPDSSVSRDRHSASRSLWSRLVARVRSWFTIPYGYEDESGFHYGPPPVPPGFPPAATTTIPVFTDRACDVMKYPDAGPELISENPSLATEPPPPVSKA